MATRKQEWCTREDLNLHAARAAASEAAASAVSPRVPIWCWLEDSNLPPLAYEASALPDELSQHRKIDKRIAAPLPVWKRPCGCAEARRRVQIWTFTMSKSAAPTGAVVTGMRVRERGRERAQARACPRHTGKFGIDFG